MKARVLQPGHGVHIAEQDHTAYYESHCRSLERGIKHLDSGTSVLRRGMSLVDWRRKRIGKAVNQKKREDVATLDAMAANRPLKPPGRKT